MPKSQPAHPRPHATPEELALLRAQLLGEAPLSARHDPYREERERLSRIVDTEISRLTKKLTELTDGTEDSDAVRAMYRSLLTVQQRAKRAIGNIPDRKIDLPPQAGNPEGAAA